MLATKQNQRRERVQPKRGGETVRLDSNVGQVRRPRMCVICTCFLWLFKKPLASSVRSVAGLVDSISIPSWTTTLTIHTALQGVAVVLGSTAPQLEQDFD